MILITECKFTHCRFYFPQFRRFTEEEFTEELKTVLAEDYEFKDFYKKDYPNWEKLNEEYRKILNMMGKGLDEFVSACDYFMKLQETQPSFIRHNLYLDLQGEVAKYIPCCGP